MSQHLRIVYLHQYFLAPDEGGGTRSYEFGRRLVAAGHEVHVVTSDRAPGADDQGWTVDDVEGMHVHRRAVHYDNAMSDAERIRAFLRFAVASSRRARSLEADVVFATSTPLTIIIPALVAVLGRRVPIVLEVRDLWPDLPIAMGSLRSPMSRVLARGLERLAYRSSERVIALSEGMKDGVVRGGVPEIDVTVIPNSADTELFGPGVGTEEFDRNNPPLVDRRMAVYAGTLGRINGVDYLAELAAQVMVLDPSIALVVVGEGGQTEMVQQRALELGVLDKNFFMLHPVPKNAMPAVLARATVCFSLFRDVRAMWDNSANKFFDALAAGRPVVINYGGWQADLIDQKSIGLVLPPTADAQAAEALVSFMSDAERMSACGERARAVGESEFSRDELFTRFEAVLQSAVDRPRFPRLKRRGSRTRDGLAR